MQWDLFVQLLARGLIAGSLYALLGVSWGIIYNTTRTFHFAHGLIYTVTAYVIVLLAQTGLHLAASILLGLVAAIALGCAIEYFAYRPMREKGGSQLSIFLTAMGIMIAGQSLVHLLFGPDSRPLTGFPEVVVPLGPITITTVDLVTVGASWLIILTLFLYLGKSKTGMMIRAVASNPEKALFIGIDSKKIFVVVFGLGSLLMGFGAFLGALDKPANPYIGLNAILVSFIVVFLGGVGSLVGAVLGGLVLGVAESLILMILPTEYKVIVTFSILFLVILFKPEGLLGDKNS